MNLVCSENAQSKFFGVNEFDEFFYYPEIVRTKKKKEKRHREKEGVLMHKFHPRLTTFPSVLYLKRLPR